MVLTVNSDYFLNQLIFVMVKCGVLFEVRTEFLNSFGFRGLSFLIPSAINLSLNAVDEA
jgi:hypothetical protein